MLVVDAIPGHRGPDPGQHLPGAWTTIWRSCRSFNKIDLPAADPERAKQEMEDIIGHPRRWMRPGDLRRNRASTSTRCWKMIVQRRPAPSGGPRQAPLQALIFDSQYDPYKGVIVYIRVKEGTVRPGDSHQDDGHRRGVYRCGDRRTCVPIGPGAVTTAWRPVRWATSPPPSRTSMIRRKSGRYRHLERRTPRAEPLPGYRPVQSHGLLRHLHRGRRQVPRPAGRAGKAPAQRRLPVL